MWRYCVTAFLLFTFSLIPLSVFGAKLTGKVTDSSTGEPVAGANVRLEGTRIGTSTGQSGDWELLQVPGGEYTLIVSHVAYRPYERWMEFSEDFTADMVIKLEPAILLNEGVVVTFDRVQDQTSPVPYTNITGQEIEERHFGQDLPVTLEGAPSMTTTTDAGNALGYSYVTMRGFDFKRVGVFLNGVMLNDPEDFYVYWVDLADFGANVEDVQIQRGVGSVPYGLPSTGGTISVQTEVYSDEPELSAEYGYGSYDTRRASVHLASGPVKDRYFFDARFSRITSDGYRDQSWADYFSYYLSGVYRGERTTTRAVLFGGPIKNHLAYLGADRETLARNRTYNPLTYEDETDNYYQPHYQLHHNWNITDDLELAQTLYYIRGDGYFNVFYPAEWMYSWDFFDLPELTVGDSTLYDSSWYRYDENGALVRNDDGEFYVDYTDAVTRMHVNNHQYGWQPRLHWEAGRNTLDVGGQIVSHRSRRWGELIWAQALPPETDPKHNWYDYEGRKLIGTGFARDQFDLTEKLTLTGALQVSSVTYQILNDKRFGNEFTESYLFAMPHFGLSYRPAKPWRLWSAYSHVTREPRLKDHYWAETGYPVIRYDNPADFEGPQIKPEKLHDFELGFDWTPGDVAFRLNGYWMEMFDEIVDIGEYDVLGQPVIDNADHSRRTGIELGAKARLPYNLYAEGNLNLARNRFVEYTTKTSILNPNTGWAEPITLDNSENHIIKAPERILNLSAGWRSGRGYLRLSVHHLTEQYLDNTENMRNATRTPTGLSFDPASSPTLEQDRRIEGYTRVDLAAGINLVGDNRGGALIGKPGAPTLQLNIYLRNLLDTEYELTGSTDAYGVYIIPAAPRHYMLGVKVTL